MLTLQRTAEWTWANLFARPSMSIHASNDIRLVRISKGFDSGALSKAKQEFQEQLGNDASYLDVESTELKPHVHKAIRIAATLMGTAPLDAGAALTGTLAVARDDGESGSRAFRETRKLLPLSTIPDTPDLEGPAHAEGFRFSVPFAESFERGLHLARQHPSGNSLSGREWFTSALLCIEGRSLSRLLRGAGISLADVQDGWHRFVTSENSPLRAEQWTDW